MPMLLSFLKRGIFIFFGGIVVSIILTNLYLKQRVQTLTEQNAATQKTLEIQNAQIEKNKIELKKYKKEKSDLVKKLENKYRVVQALEQNCEAQLQAVRNANDIFYNRD